MGKILSGTHLNGLDRLFQGLQPVLQGTDCPKRAFGEAFGVTHASALLQRGGAGEHGEKNRYEKKIDDPPDGRRDSD